MQRTPKKLNLHRETILHLNSEAMSMVAGGTQTGVVRRQTNTDIEITGMLCSDVPVVTTFC